MRMGPVILRGLRARLPVIAGASATLLGLAVAQGCGDGPALDGPASAPSAALLASSPPPVDSPAMSPPASRVGSAITRSPAGDRLYVAHEDLGVLRSVALDRKSVV